MNNPRMKWMFRSQEHRADYNMGFKDACKAMGVESKTLQASNKAVYWTESQLKNIQAGTDPDTGPYAPTSHLRP